MAQAVNHTTVLAIDIRRQTMHHYSMLGEGSDSIAHNVKHYVGRGMDDSFFEKFKEAVAAFAESAPSEEIRKIAVVIPDEAVALDNVRLPVLRTPKLQQNAVNVKLDDIYSNRKDLRVLTFMAEKNKQYCTFNATAIQTRILNGISAACSENRMLVDALTYASASTISAVSALAPKWKNENYLFLDIKDIYARFIFVAGGRCVGFYTLPFGMEYLMQEEYQQEDMLFDHTMAELTVVNAREKAKAKKLSVLAETSDAAMKEKAEMEAMIAERAAEEAEESDEEYFESEEESAEKAIRDARTQSAALKVKVLPKKTPRRLPMFMQRPVPQTTEEIVQEHFRVFVKWALSLLQNNPTLLAFGAPKFVAVNLPQSLSYVIDNLAGEEEETKIPFVRFDAADDKEDVARNLELFGGFQAKTWHVSQKF